MTAVVAEALHWSDPEQQRSGEACFNSLLHSCFGTAMRRRIPPFFAEAALLQRGALAPSYVALKQFPYFRGPHLL